jgi:drug/metabolite transporter (DMT)-like permease
MIARSDESGPLSAHDSENAVPTKITRTAALGLANLLVVYVVWSSTYLAIRLTVRQGGGFPPFFMGSSRLLAAALILGVWLRLRKSTLKISLKELVVFAVSGVVLWVGGNGMVNWAEQHADSSFAALVIGSTPIFVCIMEAILDRRASSINLVVAMLVGFAGLAVLVGPSLRSGSRADWTSTLALCFGTICWGAGSIYISRRVISAPPMVVSFYQQLFGGLGYLAVGLLFREPLPHPSPQAWLAWGYLIVFGSLIAYTSFLVALRTLPISVVMTYGYVNPLLALAIGWIALDEPLTWSALVGTFLILLGVAGVFHAKYEGQRKRDDAS